MMVKTARQSWTALTDLLALCFVRLNLEGAHGRPDTHGMANQADFDLEAKNVPRPICGQTTAVNQWLAA